MIYFLEERKCRMQAFHEIDCIESYKTFLGNVIQQVQISTKINIPLGSHFADNDISFIAQNIPNFFRQQSRWTNRQSMQWKLINISIGILERNIKIELTETFKSCSFFYVFLRIFLNCHSDSQYNFIQVPI